MKILHAQNRNNTNKIIVICILILVLISPYIYILLSNAYVNRPDETFQLQAAYRLTQGHGITCSIDPSNDLSECQYTYLTLWPHGYSLIISGMLKIGLSLDLAAKFFKIIVLFLSIFLWYILIFQRYISDKRIQMIFVAFFSFFCVSCSYSSTDLLLIAIFSLITWLCIAYQNLNISRKKIIWYLFICSILIAFSILLKYNAIVFLFIAVGWIIFNNKFYDIKKIVVDLFVLLFIPLLTFFLIRYLNDIHGGGNTRTEKFTFEFLENNFLWYLNLLLDYLRIFTTQLFQLDRFLYRFNILTQPRLILNIISLVLLPFIIYIFYSLWKKGNNNRVLIKWFLTSIFITSSFLFLFLGFMYLGKDAWNPFSSEGRYYWFLIPVLFTIILSFINAHKYRLGDKKNIIRNVLTTLIIITFGAVILIYSFVKNKDYKKFNIVKQELIEKLDEIKSDNKNIPIFSVANSPYFEMIQANDYIPHYRNQNFIQAITDSFIISEPTLIIVVNNYRDSIKEPSRYYSIKSFTTKENFKQITEDDFNIYWKLFDKREVL